MKYFSDEVIETIICIGGFLTLCVAIITLCILFTREAQVKKPVQLHVSAVKAGESVGKTSGRFTKGVMKGLYKSAREKDEIQFEKTK